MRIQHKFKDMYDILCRFLYRFCCIDEIKVRLYVVMCHKIRYFENYEKSQKNYLQKFQNRIQWFIY